eukprot:gene7456-596_t
MQTRHTQNVFTKTSDERVSIMRSVAATSASSMSESSQTEEHPHRLHRHEHQDPQGDHSLRCMKTDICDPPDLSNLLEGGTAPNRSRYEGLNRTKGCENRGHLACVVSASERRERIVEAAQWSWEGYKKHAWGHDEMGITTENPYYDWM